MIIAELIHLIPRFIDKSLRKRIVLIVLVFSPAFMMIHEKLKDLLFIAGLKESEVFVYLELLKRPAQTKWELVTRTGLNRSQVYRAFNVLEEYKMIEKGKLFYRALSLKAFIEELNRTQRNTGKLVQKIRNIAPFLRLPREAVDQFDVSFTKDQILEDYIRMSEGDYSTCFDFGDLEGYVPILGGLDPLFKFREKRFKHAKNMAVCTTIGPYTECMARKTDMNKFQSQIDLLKIHYVGKWIIFSDTADYVMFNDFSNPDDPSSVLIKSKVIAESQRMMFDQFYQNFEKY